MTRLLVSLALLLGLSLLATGCSDRDRRGGLASAAQSQSPSVGGPAPGQPNGGPGNAVTVAQLTGDADDLVSAEDQDLVRRAFPLGETDQPLDF